MRKGFWTSVRRHAGVWHAVWRARHSLDPRSSRGREERAFLPAALEIQDSPPAPLGRAILWTIMAFFTVAVIWSIVGQVDIVATAHGKIIPSGLSKTIQPMEIGVVRSIHVANGDVVTAGDPLIDLDTTISRAEQARVLGQLVRARAERARLSFQFKLIGQKASAPPTFIAPPDTPPPVIARQNQLLRSSLAEHRAQVDALDQQIAQHRAELASARAQAAKLEQTLPLITERAKGLKQLSDKGYGPRYDYLKVEAQRINQAQELAVQRARIDQLKAAVGESRKQRQALESGFRRTTLADLAKVNKTVASLEQEFVKAREHTELKHLAAPVSGVVQQLAVHTVGGVVTPAQALMVIVPEQETLEVKAWIANRDIGFVHEGQPAEVKVAAFQFTRYGTIDARLTDVSNDAIQDEKLGLVFAAKAALDRAFMNIDGKRVRLTPGMAVTVEVKTGQRRLIEYFLSPLLRYGKESVRER